MTLIVDAQQLTGCTMSDEVQRTLCAISLDSSAKLVAALQQQETHLNSVAVLTRQQIRGIYVYCLAAKPCTGWISQVCLTLSCQHSKIEHLWLTFFCVCKKKKILMMPVLLNPIKLSCQELLQF